MKTKSKITLDKTGLTIRFEDHWCKFNSDGTYSADPTTTKEINDYLEKKYQILNKERGSKNANSNSRKSN